MKTHLLVWGTVIVCALCATSACTHGAADAGSNAAQTTAASNAAAGGEWTANGATACDTYLTPDFVGQVLKNPAGHSKKLGAQACSFESTDFSSINITLIAAGPAEFDAHQQYQTNPVPLPGVGDKAVRTPIGIEAVKGSDRMCSVDVTGSKLSGEALAQKVGEVCNKLFALP